MYTTTLSDEKITKIKVADLDELYNFVGDDFLAGIICYFKNLFEVVIF
jgi:hypothetical protein